MNSLVVVIPAYNASATIARAVRSAFDAGADQVLVVDDVSGDDTMSQAESAGADVIAMPSNGGASAARRHGLRLSESRYVIFLDADDALEPEGVRRSFDALEADSTLSVAAGRVIGLMPDGRRSLLARRFVTLDTSVLLRQGHGPWPPGAAMVRRSAAQAADELAIPHIRTKYAEDYELIIRLAIVGGVLQHDIPSLEYRMLQGKSTTVSDQPLIDKEAIRSHYATHLGLDVPVLTPRQVAAAGYRRRVRERVQRREWGTALRLAIVAIARHPLETARTMFAQLRRRAGARTSPATPVRHRAFVWATGQDDNIGDSLLRRPYVRAVGNGQGASVWVRDASPSFVAGLGLSSEDTVVRSWGRWYWQCAVAAVRGRATIAINAGEMRVSHRGAIKITLLLPIMAIARLRAGRALWIGAGVPASEQSALVAIYRTAARMATFTRWRDAASAELMGTGAVAPDWAFAEGSDVAQWPEQHDRDLLTLTLRGDRPFPSAEWWSWVDHTAQSLGLTVVAVVQVARDTGYAQRAASEHGAQLVDWPAGLDHAAQEARLRELYGRSLLTIADRLHALVMAATEGSIPLSWVPSSTGKSRRHFDAVGMETAGQFEGASPSLLPNLTSGWVVEQSSELAARIAEARNELANVRGSMRQNPEDVRRDGHLR